MMRTFGKINGVWTPVVTDANGHDDYVYITALIQELKLITGESPFYGTSGIPAQDSLVTQVFPDFYVSAIQQKYAPYFAILTISKTGSTEPIYQINLTTKQGVVVNQTVAV